MGLMLLIVSMVFVQAPFPTGVYWAGEYSYNNDPRRWELIDADLQTLKTAGVNTIWITHLSSGETATFARQADRFGMRVVAAVADLDVAGDAQWWKRDPAYYTTTIPAVLSDWGMAPRPLAWCLGDEPDRSLAGDYAEYLSAWNALAPNEPTCVVVTRGNVLTFGGLGFDAVTNDTYPFTVPGTGGYPDGPISAWLTTCWDNVVWSPTAWSMAQGFSKPNVWRVPTPAEMRWQLYSAVALGSRGVFTFAWSPGDNLEGLSTLDDLPETFSAMSQVYRRLGRWSSRLANMTDRLVTFDVVSGTVIATGRDAQNRALILTVAGPDADARLTVKTTTSVFKNVDALEWVVAREGSIVVDVPAGQAKFWVGSR